MLPMSPIGESLLPRTPLPCGYLDQLASSPRIDPAEVSSPSRAALQRFAAVQQYVQRVTLVRLSGSPSSLSLQASPPPLEGVPRPLRPCDCRIKKIRMNRAADDALLPPAFAVGQPVLVKYFDRVHSRYHWMAWHVTAVDSAGRTKTQCYSAWHEVGDPRIIAAPSGISPWAYARRLEAIDTECGRR